MSLLSVNDLVVAFDTPEGNVQAVNRISFAVESGETLGIVGESGSGKSQTVLALMGLLADNGTATGSARFQEQEILNLDARAMNRIRGEKIAMIFQDPMTSLNPYLRIARQMTEVLVQHKGMSHKDALAESVRLLDAVHIPEARQRINQYPHEFSGGMRQRVMIAMALLCGPDLLIADEPTTALDVTVQAQILTLLRDLKRDFGAAIILITHDLGVVAGVCDNVLVMYAGQIMEYGSLDDIFYRTQHPYTRGLLQSVPQVDGRGLERLTTIAGNPPNLLHLPQGCPFFERCDVVMEPCQRQRPALETMDGHHARACHLGSGQ